MSITKSFSRFNSSDSDNENVTISISLLSKPCLEYKCDTQNFRIKRNYKINLYIFCKINLIHIKHSCFLCFFVKQKH